MNVVKATVVTVERSDARPRDVGLQLRLPPGVTVKKGDIVIVRRNDR